MNAGMTAWLRRSGKVVSGAVAAGFVAQASVGCMVSGRADPIVVSRAPSPSARHPPPPLAAPPPPAPVAPDASQPDPDAARLFVESFSQPSAPLAVSVKPPQVTAIGLANTERGEAAGMTPEPSMTVAALQEGQRASIQVSVGPGECATFIAQGGLGLVEVDLFLTVGSGSSLRILAQDQASGPIAVVGGHGACFKNPQQGPLELSARARRGAGLVIVRGYRK